MKNFIKNVLTALFTASIVISFASLANIVIAAQPNCGKISLNFSVNDKEGNALVSPTKESLITLESKVSTSKSCGWKLDDFKNLNNHRFTFFSERNNLITAKLVSASGGGNASIEAVYRSEVLRLGDHTNANGKAFFRATSSAPLSSVFGDFEVNSEITINLSASQGTGGGTNNSITSCDPGNSSGPKINLSIEDKSKRSITQAPIAGEIVFYISVYVKDSCIRNLGRILGDWSSFSRSFFGSYEIQVAAEGKSKIVDIFDSGYLVDDLEGENITELGNGLLKVEMRKAWQVSGLPANNADRSVQVDDNIRVFAVLDDKKDLLFHGYGKTEIISLQVVEGSGDTGGGGSNSGSTDLPIAGRVESPIRIDSIGELLVALLKYLVGFLGGLAVLFIVIGGVRMVTSAGVPGQIEAGKKTITWAVIGLVVALLAFTIVNVVQNVLQVK